MGVKVAWIRDVTIRNVVCSESVFTGAAHVRLVINPELLRIGVPRYLKA